jgi:antitoxin component YwqK of YwqJK toxin-antitoxin module
MKNLFSLLALMFITSQLFAQTQKVYLTKSGKFTPNAEKASSYLLVQKLNSSEGYLATQYDMRNNLVSKGTYKDEQLTVPSGKFVYYAKDDNGVFHNASYKEENKYYMSSIGYFANGKREGMWTEYAPNGDKTLECNYENGLLNGAYKAYANNYTGEGTAVNGQINGKFDWHTNGMLAAELYYDNGKLKSKSVYLKPAFETKSLDRYLANKLYKYSKYIYDSKLVVKFTVDEKGNVVNPTVVEGYSADINRFVLTTLAAYDGFQPAKYNGKPIAQEYTQTFKLYTTDTGTNSYGPCLPSERCLMHGEPPTSAAVVANFR